MTAASGTAGASTAERQVLIALLPGLVASTALGGPGTLLNLAFAGATLWLLDRAWRPANAPAGLPWVAAVMLAFTLPPATPGYIVAACALALGGVVRAASTRPLPFNPAMLAAALVFVLYPGRLPGWPAAPVTAGAWPQQLQQAITGAMDTGGMDRVTATDGSTGATALVAMAQRAPLTISEVTAQHPAFGAWGAAGGEWVALAWLAGGLWLLQRRAITWHVPLGCVVGVTLTAALLYEGDGAHGGSSPLLHLLAGGTLLVAFFALTEPRGRPQTHAGQLLVGLFAGALVVALREHAGGADRAAVVVLLANALAPAFDALGTRLRRPPNRPPRLGAHDAAPPEGPAPHTDGRT